MTAAKPGPGGGKLPKLSIGQIFIVLGLLSTVITILIFRGMVSNQPEPEKVEVETAKVLVAKHSIAKGQTIQAPNVKLVDWPEDAHPGKDQVYDSKKDVVGRVAQTDIYAGQPIYRINLAKKGTRGGLTVFIPDGMRAITVRVSEAKGVGGFIKPNDHVDILASFDIRVAQDVRGNLPSIPWETGIPITDTVVQDVKVLAIAQETFKSRLPSRLKSKPKEGEEGAKEEEEETEDDKKSNKEDPDAKIVSTITLAVTPEQAEQITFAEDRGKLKLVLRNQTDHVVVPLVGTITDDVLSLKEALTKGSSGSTPEPKLPALDFPIADLPIAPARSVEVIQGTDSNVVSF